MASVLCQKWFKKSPFFLSKSLKFHVVWTLQFWSNYTNMWYKHFYKECMERLILPMPALTAAAGKSFTSKFTSKFDFPIGYFILLLLCWYWKSEVSPYIIWNRPVKHVAESSLKTYIISSRNGWALYQLDGFNHTWIIITLFDKY